MGTWSVSTSGENYIMEYSNGFKRSIRRSQVTKTRTSLGIVYASSQSPNLTLAEIVYRIQSYTAGTTTIGFTDNGSDDFDIDFKIAPTSYQPDTETIDSYDWEVTFWAGGNDTGLGSGNETADSTFNVTGNGAGVYDIDITYNLSDGSTFKITKLVKVNGSGTILAIVEAGGIAVNSVSGLDIDVSADITQVGVTYPITWGVLTGGGAQVLPQTGADVVLTLPADTTKLFTVLTLDSVFTDDYSGGGALVVSEVTIS